MMRSSSHPSCAHTVGLIFDASSDFWKPRWAVSDLIRRVYQSLRRYCGSTLILLRGELLHPPLVFFFQTKLELTHRWNFFQNPQELLDSAETITSTNLKFQISIFYYRKRGYFLKRYSCRKNRQVLPLRPHCQLNFKNAKNIIGKESI